jgi:hypothetical protein
MFGGNVKVKLLQNILLGHALESKRGSFRNFVSKLNLNRIPSVYKLPVLIVHTSYLYIPAILDPIDLRSIIMVQILCPVLEIDRRLLLSSANLK